MAFTLARRAWLVYASSRTRAALRPGPDRAAAAGKPRAGSSSADWRAAADRAPFARRRGPTRTAGRKRGQTPCGWRRCGHRLISSKLLIRPSASSSVRRPPPRARPYATWRVPCPGCPCRCRSARCCSPCSRPARRALRRSRRCRRSTCRTHTTTGSCTCHSSPAARAASPGRRTREPWCSRWQGRSGGSGPIQHSRSS